jgi:L-ascorbate metabolism protein UlaG (beta-lactamase superfamily)
MRTKFVLLIILNVCLTMSSSKVFSQGLPDHDIIKDDGKEIGLYFIGHASLYITYGDLVIHVDPVTAEGDYSKLPKADLILITHDHYDHLDLKAISLIKKPGTKIVCNITSASQLQGALVMKNGDSTDLSSVKINAVPAYNIKHMRSPGKPFHSKGEGNGYVITLGSKRIYVAGDTENIPEMANLKNIDIAFLPMNLPYTMDPEMVADCLIKFHPKILYPYHFGSTDTSLLLPLVDTTKTEVRIRKMN